jgi:hypothetical protein
MRTAAALALLLVVACGVKAPPRPPLPPAPPAAAADAPDAGASTPAQVDGGTAAQRDAGTP